MSKMDKLMESLGQNILESVGGDGVSELVVLSPEQPQTPGDPRQGVSRAVSFRLIEIDRIQTDPEQPRRHFDEAELLVLAESMKRIGQLQAIVVRWSAEVGGYVVVSGERRVRAARLAGLATLKCEVEESNPDAIRRYEAQIDENLVRTDLNVFEKGDAYRQLMRLRGWTQEQLAEAKKISMGNISKTLTISDRLAPELHESARCGRLPFEVAYEIARLADAEEQQQLANDFFAGSLTRREVKSVVQRKKGKRRPESIPAPQFVCTSPSGVLVTITYPRQGKPGYDTLISALKTALTQAQQAQENGTPIQEFPGGRGKETSG